MELIAAFLTGVVGPALYLLINKVLLKRSLKKKCKVREAIVDTTIINDYILTYNVSDAAGNKFLATDDNKPIEIIPF